MNAKERMNKVVMNKFRHKPRFPFQSQYKHGHGDYLESQVAGVGSPYQQHGAPSSIYSGTPFPPLWVYRWNSVGPGWTSFVRCLSCSR